MGLWREGNALDVVDKQLSRPFFNLAFPSWLELALAVPGAYCGLPHAFLGSSPLGLAWLAGGGGSGLLGLAAAGSLLGGVFATFTGLLHWIDLRKNTKHAVFALPVITLATLACPLVPPAARTAGLFSMSAACLAVAAIVPFKASTGRLRPAVVLRLADGEGPPRTAMMKSYIAGMCTGGQAREALPSADTGIMGANVFVLLQVWVNPPAPWAPAALAALLLGLSCLGRMYFWAHHLLDVAIGAVVGALSAALLDHFGLGGRFVDAVLCYFLFLAGIALMQRRTKIFDGHSNDHAKPKTEKDH